MNLIQKLLRRRRFIVDRRFQFSLMWRSTLFSLFTLAVLGVAWFGPLIQELQTERPATLDSVDGALVLLYVHDRLWWVVGAYLAVALLHSVHLSHRIAGPLVRFKRHLRLIGEGRLPEPLHTRAKDYLKHEVELLNQTVSRLGNHASVLRDANASQRTWLKEAEACLATADMEAACGLLAKALAANEAIDVRLAVFLGEAPESLPEHVPGPPQLVAARD